MYGRKCQSHKIDWPDCVFYYVIYTMIYIHIHIDIYLLWQITPMPIVLGLSNKYDNFLFIFVLLLYCYIVSLNTLDKKILLSLFSKKCWLQIRYIVMEKSIID